MCKKFIAWIVISASLFTIPTLGYAREWSLEMKYCQKTSGYHQRILESCLMLMSSVAQYQIESFFPNDFEKSSQIVEQKCEEVGKKLERDGVGSAGALVMAECKANNWASIRNEKFKSRFK